MHENLIIDEPAIAHCASFGFTGLQTTLLSCIPGVVEIVTIFTGVLAARRPNSRAYVGAAYFVPSWLGILLVNLLPWSDKVCGGFREPIYRILNITISGRTSFWPVPVCVRCLYDAGMLTTL
jgi:hypothetical protein